MVFPPLHGRFGAWLKHYREVHLVVTQWQLAERIGCAPSSVESYEQERMVPSEAMARRIAYIIGYPDEDSFVVFARQARQYRRSSKARGKPIGFAEFPTSAAPILEAAQWPIFIEEHFLNNRLRWGLGLRDDGTGCIIRMLLDGSYCLILEPRHPNGCLLGGDSSLVAPSHFYVHVVIEKVSGPADAMAGLHFEELHDSHQSVFHARFGEQSYAVATHQDGGNTMVHHIPWMARPDIIHTHRNVLAMLVEAEEHTFFINSIMVGKASIPRTSGARLDIGIGSVAIHQRAVFLYRDLIIRVPPQAAT